jgi:membrane protease YdiL (CAAX protease family)
MDTRKFFSNIGMGYFVLAVLTIGLQFAVAEIINFFAPQLWNNSLVYWIASVGPMYLIAMPVCAKILQRVPAVRLHTGNLKFGKWFRLLCISMFVMEAGNLIGNAVTTLISNVSGHDLTFSLEDVMMNESTWTVLLFSVILAPILEELVFRKLLIDRVVVFGDKTAILLSGLLFGLFHGNFYQVFYAFGLGCVLAYIYIRTGKIKYTISLHMTINLLGGLIPSLLMKNLDLSYLTGNVLTADLMGYLFAHFGALMAFALFEILMFALAIAGLVFLILSVKDLELRPGEYEMSAGRTAKAIFGNAGMLLFFAACVLLFALDMMA